MRAFRMEKCTPSSLRVIKGRRSSCCVHEAALHVFRCYAGRSRRESIHLLVVSIVNRHNISDVVNDILLD